MTYEQLYNSTPRQLHNRNKGFIQLQEHQERQHLETMRLHAVWLINNTNPYLKDAVQLTDLAVFPWEKEKKYKQEMPLSEEQKQASKRIAEAMDRDAKEGKKGRPLNKRELLAMTK